MKRALCFLLCVALLCTAVPMTAVAEFGGISLSGQLTEGNSVDVMWHPYTGEGFDHYEYSVKDLTNGGDAAIFRVHTNQEKFSIPANMMIVNHNLRVWVGACDVNSDVLAQAQTEFLVQAAQEELVISLTDVKPGDHVYVSWNKISGAKHYDYTVRNTTTDTVIIDRTSTRADQITISGDLILSENHYKVWVGAVDENGDVICDSIQYFDVPKCSHRNPQRVNKQHNWQQNDDETHHVTEYYDKKCVDCGELIEEGLVDEYDEPHQLDENGDCTLCDYRFSCPHTEKEYRLKSETYTPDGEEEHIHDVQYSEYCANAICGKLLRDQADEKRIHEREMHTFDKGVCILCGYRRAAQLSASVARGMSEAQVGDLLSATVTFKGGDGNYRYCWEIYCNGTLVRERTPFDAQHSMSIQAECAGEYVFRVIVMDGEGSEATADSKPITVKEAACLHTETEDVESDLYYESISDSHHNKITEYSRVCKACGERVSTWDSPVSEEHHFVDGVCQECKLPEPGECAHSEKKSEELRRTKRSISDTQHVIEVYYRDVCAKCGVELVAERMENAGEEAHALVDGRCECGYVDTTGACDHADREETPGAPVCVSISDTQHKTTVAYKVVCKTCGAELEGREESLVADHTFDAHGLCAECGYQKLVETVSGSFGSTTYTMTTGTPLTVTVSAQCTGGELAKVTINGVTASMASPSSMDIAGGTEWNGNLTIDGTQSPFDVPGIYEVQLWVKTATGLAQSVARTTITVVEPEVELSMTVQGSVDEAGNVNFNWNGIESADHYGINFRINDVPEYGDIHMIGKETSYQIPASRFQGEETVKFWVAAYDAGNNMIPVSSTSTNKVQADTTITVPARAKTVSGSFGSATYTMTAGTPLTVTVSAQCTGGELAKVTINGVTASMVSPSSIDIAGGTEWSGNLTIDGTQSPFDVPGTYEVQLWVKTVTGLAQSVARTTITVEAPVTPAPTEVSTVAPTEVLTVAPTEVPTVAPTEVFTEAPTEAPTVVPTDVPTIAPVDEARECSFYADGIHHLMNKIDESHAAGHHIISYCACGYKRINKEQDIPYKKCCLCIGHEYDEETLCRNQNGRWYQICKRCKEQVEVNVLCPVHGKTHIGDRLTAKYNEANHTEQGHAIWVVCSCGDPNWGYYSTKNYTFSPKCEQCVMQINNINKDDLPEMGSISTLCKHQNSKLTSITSDREGMVLQHTKQTVEYVCSDCGVKYKRVIIVDNDTTELFNWNSNHFEPKEFISVADSDTILDKIEINGDLKVSNYSIHAPKTNINVNNTLYINGSSQVSVRARDIESKKVKIEGGELVANNVVCEDLIIDKNSSWLNVDYIDVKNNVYIDNAHIVTNKSTKYTIGGDLYLGESVSAENDIILGEITLTKKNPKVSISKNIKVKKLVLSNTPEYWFSDGKLKSWRMGNNVSSDTVVEFGVEPSPEDQKNYEKLLEDRRKMETEIINKQREINKLNNEIKLVRTSLEKNLSNTEKLEGGENEYVITGSLVNKFFAGEEEKERYKNAAQKLFNEALRGGDFEKVSFTTDKITGKVEAGFIAQKDQYYSGNYDGDEWILSWSAMGVSFGGERAESIFMSCYLDEDKNKPRCPMYVVAASSDSEQGNKVLVELREDARKEMNRQLIQACKELVNELLDVNANLPISEIDKNIKEIKSLSREIREMSVDVVVDELLNDNYTELNELIDTGYELYEDFKEIKEKLYELNLLLSPMD